MRWDGEALRDDGATTSRSYDNGIERALGDNVVSIITGIGSFK